MTSPSPNPDTVLSTLPIIPSVDEIPKVAEWLDLLAEQDDWPPALGFGLNLSVEEALANVISHGFEKFDSPPQIRLEYLRLPAGEIAIRVVDNGRPFDPTAIQSPEMAESVEGAKIGGHGVRLMRHFLSSISYARVGEENQLTLVAAKKSA